MSDTPGNGITEENKQLSMYEQNEDVPVETNPPVGAEPSEETAAAGEIPGQVALAGADGETAEKKPDLFRITLSRMPHAAKGVSRAIKYLLMLAHKGLKLVHKGLKLAHRGLVRLFAVYVFRLTFVLFAVASLSALVLGFVYNAALPVIEEHKAETERQAMSKVMAADSFSKADTVIEDKNVSAIYRAKTGNRLVGYVVESSGGGYGGKVIVIVGVSLEGQITGVELVSHNETPGLGGRAEKDLAFTAQYKGLSGGLQLGNEIDALSGATITSKAVTDAVNSAVSAALAYQTKGG